MYIRTFVQQRNKLWSDVGVWSDREVNGFVIENIVQKRVGYPLSHPNISEDGNLIGDGGVDVVYEGHRLDIKTRTVEPLWYDKIHWALSSVDGPDTCWNVSKNCVTQPRCDYLAFYMYNGLYRYELVGVARPNDIAAHCNCYAKGDRIKELSNRKRSLRADHACYIVSGKWLTDLCWSNTDTELHDLYMALKFQTEVNGNGQM